MKIRSSRETRILTVKTVCRWYWYIMLILFAFSTMNAGTFRRPILLIPVAICISSFTGELQAAGIGALCGYLIDIGCNKLYGFNAVILCFFCVWVSLLHTHLLRNRLVNIIAITALAAFIQGVLDYKFYYDIWKYDPDRIVFRSYVLPVWSMTMFSTFFVYLLILLINKLMMPRQHFSIEDAAKRSAEERSQSSNVNI